MSASRSPLPEVVVLPSLPPSPSFLDEVFSHPRPWSVRLDNFDFPSSRRSSSGSASSYTKGKDKRTLVDEDDEGTQKRMGTLEAYPPTTDEAAETRRVEETLKRWELAERQRRKSARESAQFTSASSLFSSVTRTAGLVLSGRTSIGTVPGPGSTRAFKSHESVDVAREGYAVPLDDIEHAHLTRDVAVHSPSPSPSLFERTASPDPGVRDASENPFEHPSERAHTPTPTAPMRPSTPPSLSPPPSPSPYADASTRRSAERNGRGHKRSSLLPPRPQSIPPPQDVSCTTQPQPTAQPVLRPSTPRKGSEGKEESRWWHEWLCGCGEGPDRGGDHQAGRTNPFE